MKQSIVTFRDKIRATINHRPNPFEELFLREIWQDECYFKGGYTVKPGDRVIDVGAHIGLFTILAAKLGAEVYAYEPVPESYEVLLMNITENGVQDKVKPFRFAVTADAREVKIDTHLADPDWNTGSARVLEEGKPSETLAPSKKLDTIYREFDLYTKKCDFLKIDCEGSEYEILYGAPTDVYSVTRNISMEFHRSLQDGKMLSNFLEHRGFDVKLKWAYGEVGIIQARKI